MSSKAEHQDDKFVRAAGQHAGERLTNTERREHRKLLSLWGRGRATRAQILKCMELDSKLVRQ